MYLAFCALQAQKARHDINILYAFSCSASAKKRTKACILYGAPCKVEPTVTIKNVFARYMRLRPLLTLAQLVLAVILLTQAARLTFQPNPRDDLRRGDALLVSGRYYDALQTFEQLAAQREWGEASLRVGIVREVRGEHVLAVRALYTALGQGVQGNWRDLTALYLGHALLAAGDEMRSTRVWAQVPVDSPYLPLVQVLRGEHALLTGDYTQAVAHYRAALTPELPTDWWALATYRLALLRGASEGPAALAELAPSLRAGDGPKAIVGAQLLTPLLPPVVPADGQLAKILRSAPDERAQLLGQLYLELGLPSLARAQFDLVPPTSPLALAAATYSAYTRIRSGDRAGGLNQLQTIVQNHPEDPRARALLALAFMADDKLDQAQKQIAVLEAAPGQQVQAQLARASWRSAQRDYIGAADAYRQLLATSSPAERGHYALLVAQFHLDSGFDLCQGGLDAADLAARELPVDADVQTVLAGSRLYCNDPGGAVIAARAALALAPRADAAYYLGAALARAGRTAEARDALVQAADLAPASSWRKRAEQVIAGL